MDTKMMWGNNREMKGMRLQWHVNFRKEKPKHSYIYIYKLSGWIMKKGN